MVTLINIQLAYPAGDGYYQVAYASCPSTTGFNVIALNVPNAATTVSASFLGLSPGTDLALMIQGNIWNRKL